jgi:hypothetical protein
VVVPPPHRHLTFGDGDVVVPQPECLTDPHPFSGVS